MIVPVIIILGLGAANPAPCRTELKLLKCTEIIDIGVVAGVHPVYPPSQNSISGRRVRALFHVTFNPMPLPKRYGSRLPQTLIGPGALGPAFNKWLLSAPKSSCAQIS